MANYAELKALFESKGCKLLTTEDDIKQSRWISHTQVSFIATCGHNNNVTVTNFKQKGSGVVCKECMKQTISEQNKINHKNKAKASLSTIQEYEVLKKLQTLLQHNLRVVITNEGCKSDIILKPQSVEEDEWLRIQVKTTIDVCHDLYTFALRGTEYTDHILLCHCINHNKYWLIPYDVVSKLKGSLNIGLTSKSYYHKYEVEQDCLFPKLLGYYQTTPLYSSDVCMLPESANQQKEYKYQQKRIEAFPFFVFEKPEYNQCYYDFKINSIPVQEKVAGKMQKKNNGYRVCLYRHSTKKSYNAYKLGMNKYYWVHIPDTVWFYVFTEDVLYQRGYIEDDKTTFTKKPMLFISLNNTNGWYQQYKYQYDNIDENQFRSMFNLQ